MNMTSRAVTRRLSDVEPVPYTLAGHWERLLAEARTVYRTQVARQANDRFAEAIKLTASRLEFDIAGHLCRHVIEARFQRNLDRACEQNGRPAMPGLGSVVVSARFGDIRPCDEACKASLPNGIKALGLVRLSRKLPADHPTWEPQSLDLCDWARQKGLQMLDVYCLVASMSAKPSTRIEAHLAWHVTLPQAIEETGVRWIVIPRFTVGFKDGINSAWCITHNVGLIEAFPRIPGNHIRFSLRELGLD
jgi:hypothetical protein